MKESFSSKYLRQINARFEANNQKAISFVLFGVQDKSLLKRDAEWTRKSHFGINRFSFMTY